MRTHDHDTCRDGGAGDASTTMLRPPNSLSERLANHLECWTPWAHLVALTWWPVVRLLQRRSAESPAWARAHDAHDALRRALPWAFRTVLLPSLSGAGMVPVGGGRMLHLPMAFGGSRGLLVRCASGHLGVVRPPPRERRRRTDRDGNVIGWRLVAR